MSVLIKGMEMPKSCDKCELMTANYGCAFVGAVGGESYRKRAWDCPLVEVPEPMKWIPVTERLPETREVVLVYGKKGGVYTAEHNRNSLRPGSFWKLNSKNHHCEPTHWMPLPQPPESEGDDERMHILQRV